ncbi:GTP cyclohydrolase I family protein [Mycobacterium kansasii 732]|nr:GTP cyclohydrolase I family protein [Mycobacterium kansasii 732]
MFDQPRAEAAVRELLYAIGEDPDRDGLRDTPARVARAYREIFGGLYTDPDTVLNTMFDEDHDELVLVKQIPLYSTCEHHLVSFHGAAHVGYIPGVDGKVTGLSKLARLVDLYAKRPQVQERLTSQIADALVKKLEPRASSSSSKPNICAWRCAGSASPVRSRRRQRCVGSSKPMPLLEPKRSISSCIGESGACAGDGCRQRHRRLVLGRRALPRRRWCRRAWSGVGCRRGRHRRRRW